MIILASKSQTRQGLLKAAGVAFTVHTEIFDEEETKQSLTALSAPQLAMALAQRKAMATSSHHPEALVIGADQTLELNGKLLHKATDKSAAREHLKQLRGEFHTLHSAVVVTKGNEIKYQNMSQARLKMRRFSGAFLSDYLDAVSNTMWLSVGCYQIESLGIQLFEDIEGDHFTILGLPMLPLLAFLRKTGEIAQ
jgi:septum formation protein